MVETQTTAVPSQAEPSTAEVRLVRATIESVHRFGLEATTVSTVTDLAGLSRGMVRLVFQSKQQMLVATYDRLGRTWTGQTDVDRAVPGPDRAREIVDRMFADGVFTDAQVGAWLVLSMAASTDESLRTIRERCQETWRRQLRQAFSDAGVAGPGQAAEGMLAAADGLWLHHRLGRGQRERARSTALRLCDAVLSSG